MNEILSQKTNSIEIQNTDIEHVAVLDINNNLSFAERPFAMDPENELKRIIVGMFLTTSDKNGNDYLVLQRRAANKKEYPNYLAMSAAGHINPEDSVDGVLDYSGALGREISEEIGLDPLNEVSIVSSFESIDKKDEGKDVKKEIVLGLGYVEFEELEKLYINEELSGIEVFRLQEIIDSVYSEKSESNKMTKPTIQSIKHLVDLGIFPKPSITKREP